MKKKLQVIRIPSDNDYVDSSVYIFTNKQGEVESIKSDFLNVHNVNELNQKYVFQEHEEFTFQYRKNILDTINSNDNVIPLDERILSYSTEDRVAAAMYSKKVRKLLIDDDEVLVLYAIAKHGSHEQRMHLADHDFSYVRKEALFHGDNEIAMKLLHDEDEDVRRGAQRKLGILRPGRRGKGYRYCWSSNLIGSG